jgi:hypothetical protein
VESSPPPKTPPHEKTAPWPARFQQGRTMRDSIIPNKIISRVHATQVSVVFGLASSIGLIRTHWI